MYLHAGTKRRKVRTCGEKDKLLHPSRLYVFLSDYKLVADREFETQTDRRQTGRRQRGGKEEQREIEARYREMYMAEKE